MRVGILYSRVRAEEKLLFEAFDQRGVDLELVDDNTLIFDITAEAHTRRFQGFDVVVERCISHGRALYSLRILNDQGIKTVNTALVADNFGRRNVGTVYGWVFCAHQIGAAMAAWGGGMAGLATKLRGRRDG